MRQTLFFLFNETNENIKLHEVHLAKSTLQLLEDVGVGCVISSIVASAVIGSYFKSGLYFYMYDTRKELKNRPINILLLVQAIIQHIVCLMLVVILTIGLLFDLTYADSLGEAWCGVIFYVGIFGAAYRNIGSLGIAVFRLMFLLHSNWVKERFGTLQMMVLILISSIVVSALMTFAFGIGNGPASRKQELYNFCIGKSGEFRKIEHEYALLRGSVLPEKEYSDLIVLVSLGFVAAEFCCYTIFFHHVYTHDKGLMKRKVLPAHKINRRHQKNAITLLGQFYGFGIETIFYYGVLITLKSTSENLFRVGLMIGFWAEFGLLSIVEVMTSHFLKQNLPHNRFLR